MLYIMIISLKFGVSVSPDAILASINLNAIIWAKAACETGERSGICREDGYLGSPAKKAIKINNTIINVHKQCPEIIQL